MLAVAEPNAGHCAVARLLELGRVSHVVTQIIDGLHQQSGDNRKEVEMAFTT